MGTGKAALWVNIALLLSLCIFVGVLHREHASRLYVRGLQKNAIRLYLLGPLYALLVLLAAYGDTDSAWLVIMGVLDAYALYCFFAMMVLGAGGEKVLRESLVPAGGTHTLWLLVFPIKYQDSNKLYRFLKLSVVQLLFTRPILLTLSVLAEELLPKGVAISKLIRVLAILALVYTVMTIGKAYVAMRNRLWPAFKPVQVFLVVKTYILLVILQDFIVGLITKRGAGGHGYDNEAPWRVNSLAIAVESLLYVLFAWRYLHWRVFYAYNPVLPDMSESPLQFFIEVLTFWHVIDEEVPPPAHGSGSDASYIEEGADSVDARKIEMHRVS